MQSWKLRRQGNKTLKNRLSEEGLGKKEELCCCCVACSVSVVPCVWPQSEGMVVFCLLRWMRQPGNKMRHFAVRQNGLCFGIAGALAWSSGVLFRAL